MSESEVGCPPGALGSGLWDKGGVVVAIVCTGRRLGRADTRAPHWLFWAIIGVGEKMQ
ncbi:MAG TPA: hypothetical protein HPP77_08260 [Candidatus Hydrogenedentes bacterium]|nr:hypothetical protein [Candidatus Hydrogenedentota bacterium]HIJ74277.1 hypothetical protein [Candidatus Hydrogenedentota bacterium]